ncbi:MAG: type II secretion system protein [Opitutaceae bacterium]
MPQPAPRLAGGGSVFPRRPRHAGFTLLEILVVIGLIALLSGVLIVGTSRLLGDRQASADEIFWKTVGEVRKSALLDNRDIRLRFDEKTKEFVAGSGELERRFPFAPREAMTVDFMAPSSVGSSASILIAGQLVETQTLPSVMFYGDGTCAPFRVQLKGKISASILEIDPWTCAPILKTQPQS